MWKESNILILCLLLSVATSSYLQFPLLRSAPSKSSHQSDPIVCKNQSTLNQDAEYHEICYEKDIAYFIPFMNNNQHVMMSVDLTIPISWIKGPDCVIEGSTKKCDRIIETFAEEVRETKKKISNKLHKKKPEKNVENAIIEGSSQVIRGQIQKLKNILFTAKDSSRLNNFFELIMLGLFIYGEHDTLKMDATNFVNATTLSDRTNKLSDGAISMRFDQSSQNSFLNEIFSYVKATEKTVTIYLGTNNTITIGDMTAKYTESGYSSIEWIDMPEDEGFGKLPKLTNIGMEDRQEDSQGQIPQELAAVLSLSASYIGLPEAAFNAVFGKFMSKQVNCTVNSKTFYVECSAANKKKFEKLKQKNIFFSFEGKNLMVPLSNLVLSEQSKKIVLNIKKTFNNRVILGEPIFLQHFIAFDYTKNKFGFAPKRLSFNEFFIDVVSLVRFLCFIFVVGCSFVLCFQPCRKMFKALSSRNWAKGGEANQNRRLKQYSPIQQNPYEDLKGKIQEVIESTEKDIEGI